MTNPLTIIQNWIEEQRRVCDAATDGPWDAIPDVGIGANVPWGHEFPLEGDLVFCATARTNYPMALELLEDQVKRLKHNCDGYEGCEKCKALQTIADRIGGGG